MGRTPTTKLIESVEQLSQENINERTPMGGNLLATGVGATFKIWAPNAQRIELLWEYKKRADGEWKPGKRGCLSRSADGLWNGFVPRMTSGDGYMFYIEGPEGGTKGLKRDPYARDLSDDPPWPQCFCLLYNPLTFPWHDQNWTPPEFHKLVIYQLHIGTWRLSDSHPNGTFLDIIEYLPYLKALNINAIQLLPIAEFPSTFSSGYNGVDYFSPETDYGIKSNDASINERLNKINALMADVDAALPGYSIENIQGTANQLRMMVDMCHVFGIAVLLDVVYNHAGGGFGDNSIYFFDHQARGNNNDSLYFTDKGWAGGLVFAYWKNEVKQYLIENAKFLLTECHCDGFRYDEVSVIKSEGGEHGWRFCQYVTDTCRYIKPQAIHIAEHWPVEQAVVDTPGDKGAGFDALQSDGFRDAVRRAIAQASGGANAAVDMGAVASELGSRKLKDNWRAINCIENHDIVKIDRGQRIARLADATNSRSWYARSRSRVAMGLLATATGIMHIFMGQEILEDKQWHDKARSPFQIWWQGLEQDTSMIDFLRFTQELLATRNTLPGLQGSGLNVFHVHNANRILAFHRWVEGEGHDVIIVASLNESTFWQYDLGFPRRGYWQEVFNSDVYDHWVNANVAGNAGGVFVDGQAQHNLPTSGRVVIAANSLSIFKWKNG